jgi:hypothetical protein
MSLFLVLTKNLSAFYKETKKETLEKTQIIRLWNMQFYGRISYRVNVLPHIRVRSKSSLLPMDVSVSIADSCYLWACLFHSRLRYSSLNMLLEVFFF